MNELLDEQVKLYFGDDYERVVERAKQYFGQTKKNHALWGRSVLQLINNEGVDIINTILCSVIEVDDLEEGLNRWAKAISAEYINGSHNKWLSLNTGISEYEYDENWLIQYDKVPPLKGGKVNASLSGIHPLSGGDIAAANAGDFLKTDEERELYQVLAHIKSHKEAAKLLGWDLKKVKKIYQRVHYRQRYATDSDFRTKRKESSANAAAKKLAETSPNAISDPC